MTYTDARGNEVELPKLTLALSRKMDAPNKATTSEDKWRSEYAFLSDAYDGDYLSGWLDGKTFDSIDLSRLDALYVGTVGIYMAPAIEAQRQQMAGSLRSLDDLDLDKVYKVADAVQAINSVGRQGFKAVR